MRRQYIEQAANVIGVDPEEVTPAHAYRILKNLVLNTSDFTVTKAKDSKKSRR
jgi:hypothetical protein